jgi:hypothetical protein
MRAYLLLLLALPLAAQQSGPAQAAKPDEAKPAQAGESKPDTTAAPAESWLTGNIDVGYRWVSGVGGNFNTYRSVTNLGSGPKLLGMDLTVQEPSRKLFDRIDIHADHWGGDPYNTVRIEARKEKIYDFRFDYRNIAYFNFLPSFADPTKETGVFLNHSSFDTYMRDADFQLDFRPGTRIIPYVAYNRNSWRGSGVSDLVLQANEYAVPMGMSDQVNNYRGGVRFEFNRAHLTIEQGALSYRTSDQLNTTSSQPNRGDISLPFFGQTLSLTSGRQAWDARGDAIYSRALFTANPVSWLDLYGQFLYSQPKVTTHFTQATTGNIFDFTTLAFYSGQSSIVNAQSKMPRPSGSFGAEVRPFRRLRITESIMTDRLHNAGSAVLLDQLVAAGKQLPALNVTDLDRIVVNYNQQELNLMLDVTSHLTLRGGHRYVWGDINGPAGLVVSNLGTESASLRRHVALAGINFHSGRTFTVNVDFEGSPGDRSYFRTSLNAYKKARIQGRYQPFQSLLLTANLSVLSNDNPGVATHYDFLSRQNTVSAYWTPGGGKRFAILAEYSRSTLRSGITYLVPSMLTPDLSNYRENAHTGVALLEIPIPLGRAQAKLSAGGSLFRSSGSRPTQFYEPVGRFSVGFGRHVQWYSEWHWYGLSETFYMYEGFRSNQFLSGLRFFM